MKVLKNDSGIYTKQIILAITDCYDNDAEPSNNELMKLYAFIGQNICEQGEKAYVVHLAQTLAEHFPQMKGFSPRNLRRMRDFYRTYENQTELMCKAQTLGWTQNAVILDCCETNEQRSFYISIASEKNLSKLVLMKAIEVGEFEMALAENSAFDACPACCPVVGKIATDEAVDTSATVKTACGAFVPVREPLRQGRGLPDNETQRNVSFYRDAIDKLLQGLHPKKPQQKRSSHPTPKRSVELLPFSIDFLIKASQLWLTNGKPPGQSPPHRWHEFRTHWQRLAFA